jgi:hypothetical protein
MTVDAPRWSNVQDFWVALNRGTRWSWRAAGDNRGTCAFRSTVFLSLCTISPALNATQISVYLKRGKERNQLFAVLTHFSCERTEICQGK